MYLHPKTSIHFVIADDVAGQHRLTAFWFVRSGPTHSREAAAPDKAERTYRTTGIIGRYSHPRFISNTWTIVNATAGLDRERTDRALLCEMDTISTTCVAQSA
jgi:hypothetical protein